MNNQFGENNPNYKNGSHLRTPKQCPVCGGKMDSRAKKCRVCKNKELTNKHSINWKNITTKKYFCLDCNKEISYSSGHYGSHKCKSCSSKKNGLPKCIDCGKELQRYNNVRCKKCNNIYLSGPRHPAFILGLNRVYPLEFSKELKLLILNRDDFKCQVCNKKGNHVHHIDYNKNNNKTNNLIILCKHCHPKTNWNRDYWYAYFLYWNNII